ncbi:uncharacterized protein LOC124919881 [Impatiens glandulifera]|uniref:uncharacterized protein LOC124919881 n=1 Tax=Impatiens glandulifera TaxID=253017 RepID=UPI001FB107D7|nr:uncharacterized protein LOC124919881 [Impatiens glandulifera]
MLKTTLLGFTPPPRFLLLNPKHFSISYIPPSSLTLNSRKLNSKKPLVCASQGGNGNGLGGDDSKEETKDRQKKENDLKRDRLPEFNVKWLELLIDPDPNNVLAVGLTGLLAWASVQVLWQLFFISLAILVAALKYSFIAAFLLFILVTLL